MNGGRSILHAARGRPLADDQVELEIFHRRIQDFLDRRLQAVDFVDEQHIARLQVGQDRGQIARLAAITGPEVRAETDPQLARHDLRQGGLAQAGRPMQQDVVQRFTARPRRLDEDRQVLPRRLLAGELGQRLRAQ